MAESNTEEVKFPKVTDTEIVFGGIPELKKFEKLAFEYFKRNKYSDHAMNIFYSGGKLPPRKAGISNEYYIEGVRYFKCWIGSWNPKHESKEAVCGFILSLITDLEDSESFKDKIKKNVAKLKGAKNAK